MISGSKRVTESRGGRKKEGEGALGGGYGIVVPGKASWKK